MAARLGVLAIVALLLGGCVIGLGPGPSTVPGQPTPPLLSPAASATSAAATPAPTATPTVVPSEAAVATPGPSSACGPGTPLPTPHVYSDIQKLQEGAHGFPPPVDLPCAVDVDYQVMGSCSFEITVTDDANTPGLPTFQADVTAPGISGTWSFTITPGSYSVLPSEAVGCTYHVTVRAHYQ